MLFNKLFVNSSRTAMAQLQERDRLRNMTNQSEALFGQIYAQNGIAVNESQVPKDVWRSMDAATVERMRLDDGDSFLNVLMPRSRAVNIGKLVFEQRRASDAGIAQTSMSGRTGVAFDKVDYNFDGFIVPIHDAGFGREWREIAAQTSEGFDSLVDDSRETAATLRLHMADSFLDGHKDANGEFLNVKGYQWTGIRNDGRVLAVDLGAGGVNFDFTDTSKTYEEIEAAVKAVRDLYWLGEKSSKDLIWFISNEIWSNLERKSSEAYDSRPIVERLQGLKGISSIQSTNRMTGNEFFGMPTDDTVRPLTGMGVSTIALPRPTFNARHDFVTMAAVGWQIETDYFGNTSTFYASE